MSTGRGCAVHIDIFMLILVGIAALHYLPLTDKETWRNLKIWICVCPKQSRERRFCYLRVQLNLKD